MHSWQDVVLAISLLAFNLALVPSVVGKQKPRVATSLTTGLFIVPQLVAFASIKLWYSFAMAFINATLWFTLAVQRKSQLTGRRK
ncbi:hypothetical protein EYC59_05030 [Candidatus Saccharibacteria bacterium]|nr:MAG: hypothetical protein EYC59_05030 [Candidatus Saccharibacteria bacterium]